jgi:hypothetical protein
MNNDLQSLMKSVTSTIWWYSVAGLASVAKVFDASHADIDATATAVFEAGDTLQRGVIDIAYAATAGLFHPRNWVRTFS